MPQFRFETEVMVKVTLEYNINASSIEEALEQLQTGEHRGEGETFDEQYDWGTEIIISEESFEE